jgi:prepilin-type N-terminal cleavage/methylation domain-containing protein
MKRNNLFRGFTLIEVLLTVMIVALIGGSLYATFAAGFKLDHRIKESFADLDESRIVSEELRRDLGRVVSYDFSGSFPEQKAFVDNDEEFLFVIDDGRQLRWVRYRLVDEQKGEVHSTELGTTSKKNIAVTEIVTTEETLQMLAREEGDFVQLFDPAKAIVPDKSEILTKRIADQGWKILYAPSVTPQAKTEWRSGWKEDLLPAAVRVNLTLQNEKGQIKKIVSDFLLPAGGHNEK